MGQAQHSGGRKEAGEQCDGAHDDGDDELVVLGLWVKFKLIAAKRQLWRIREVAVLSSPDPAASVDSEGLGPPMNTAQRRRELDVEAQTE